MIKIDKATGCLARLCLWLLAPATVIDVDGEGLDGSEYSGSDMGDMDGIDGPGELSEDELEEIIDIPHPHAKRMKKWL